MDTPSYLELYFRGHFFTAQNLEDEEPNDVVFYVLLRAVDRFFEEYNVYPGYYTQQVEADVNKLKVISASDNKLFIPEFLKWTLPSLNLDMSAASNKDFSVKSKRKWQTV